MMGSLMWGVLLFYTFNQANAYLSYLEGSVDFCMYEYSYTYSKCLSLCKESTEPACVSDSMCICDINMEQKAMTRTELLDPKTTCVKTTYCDISCREKTLNGHYFKEGNLCQRDERSSCVCFF